LILRSLQAVWCAVGLLAVVSAVALAASMLTGCLSLPDGPLPLPDHGKTADSAATAQREPVFHATLKIQADGQEYQGTASLKRVNMGRRIKFEIPAGTYLLTIGTCAGELVVSRPKVEWYEWNYVPVFGLENLESCLTIATAITDRGEIYKALIDYNEGDDLPATVTCNRDALKLSGAGICQSRAEYGKPGLVQKLAFDVPTVFAAQPGCPEPQTADWLGATNYELNIGPGLCVYKFQDQKRRKFRLTTYGYTTIQHVLPLPK